MASMIYNIATITGRLNWSAGYVMTNIKNHSKHKITVKPFSPPKNEDLDILYYRYGTIAIRHKLQNYKERGWKVIVGISGMGTLSKWKRGNRWSNKIKDVDAITVNSTELLNICSQLQPEKPIYNLPSGVDMEMFPEKPIPLDFNIGWAGFPKNMWKRFKDFLELPFEKKWAGGSQYIPYDKMPGFYGGISVYVSTSIGEGSPLPPKEAASTGRPVVATRAGDLMDWLPEDNLFDTYLDMIPRLEELRDNRDLLLKEGRNSRELVKPFNYNVLVSKYDKAFESVMNGDQKPNNP